MTASPQLASEILLFFESFASAFCEFNGPLIARRYADACVALHADGTLDLLNSREQVAAYMQNHLDRYRLEGCSSCRFRDLEVLPLGRNGALATLSWELLREDGSVASGWRESYNLVRGPGGFRIYATADHAG